MNSIAMEPSSKPMTRVTILVPTAPITLEMLSAKIKVSQIVRDTKIHGSTRKDRFTKLGAW